MTLLTLAQVREHVETDLVDDALQRIIDAEDEEILRRFGPPTTQTEIFTGGTGATHLFLSRPVTSVTSISEEVSGISTTLSADDYDIWWNQALERLDDGTNASNSWGDRVTVVYVPQERTSQRILTLIQLVQLAVRYNGVQTESIGSGDHSVGNYDYRHERERLLSTLAPRGGIWLA
jgi:hypothetical protein